MGGVEGGVWVKNGIMTGNNFGLSNENFNRDEQVKIYEIIFNLFNVYF